MGYTFGDNQEASRRLRRLAEVYEPETRDFLHAIRAKGSDRPIDLALDLGCGPGWSTLLIRSTLSPKRTVGLEGSQTYVAEARSNHPDLEFICHDVLITPFPVDKADLIFCRFLLTHLPSPHAVLESWAHAATGEAMLAIHETEALESAHPELSRYYELVAQMQKHYGQELNVGGLLTQAFADTKWRLIHNESVVVEKSARDMAQLHAANLRTWKSDDFAIRTLDMPELNHIERQLDSIASGAINAGTVHNRARQIIARRDSGDL